MKTRSSDMLCWLFFPQKKKRGKEKRRKKLVVECLARLRFSFDQIPVHASLTTQIKCGMHSPIFHFFSLPPLSVFSLLLCLPHLKAYPVSWQYNPGVFLTFVFTTGGLFVCHTKERKDLKVHDNLLRMKELKWLSCARIYLKMLDNAYEKALVKSWTNSNAPSFHYFIV